MQNAIQVSVMHNNMQYNALYLLRPTPNQPPFTYIQNTLCFYTCLVLTNSYSVFYFGRITEITKK